MQTTIRRSLPLQYALPVSLTALATALWWLLVPSLGIYTPFILLYPVIMVAGWYGGLRPALFATLITTVARLLLSSHPVGHLSSLGPLDLVQVALFVMVGLLISGLCEAMHRARRQAEEQTLRSQHHERELERSEERFRLAAEAVNCLIYDWDPITGVSKRTRGLFELLGFQPEEAEPNDQWWNERIHPDDRLQATDAIESAVREGNHFGATYRIQHRDGHYLYVWDQGLVLHDENGRVTRVVGSTVDLSVQKAAEAEISLAKEEAEAANRAKDHFIAVLSHELRTPLSPVLVMAQTLEATPGIDEEMRSGLEIIRRNAELEARLIDDLLDLTRISRGKLQLSMEEADLHTLLRNALEITNDDIAARQLFATLDLAAPNARVNGDPARLQQVFWNVIKNAVKFTPTGGSIVIRSSRSRERMIVEIIDTGIGIEREMLPRIFNAFEQGVRASMPQFGGLGLGLAVSRALVELHGGTITASSEGPDRGTTIRIELPVMTGNGVEVAGEPAPIVAEESRRGLRILLVDDHLDTSKVFTILLRSRGHTVVTAHNVADGLALALREDFDLLISDISMPDGTGLDLVRRIHEQKPIRAIALSGFGMEEDVRRSLENGFVEHLVKPVSQQRLFEAIGRVIGGV